MSEITTEQKVAEPKERDDKPKVTGVLVRGHTYLCMCELCRKIPIWEHPDAFE